MTLTGRWEELWTGLGLTMPAAARPDAILARWSEPHRSYHTVQHLTECLAWLDDSRSLARDPRALELALWYHDTIYDPRKSDNERASADLARLHLREGGAASDTIEAVAALILWTTHTAAPPSGDPALLVDIDLAILGALPVRYAEYEEQVKAEYAWVPKFLFRRRRAALLQTFLDRPRIYATALLHDRLEERARRNLGAAVAALRT